MICTTVKEGTECSFMTKNGCSYIGGMCREVVEQCEGCAKKAQLDSGWYCSSCPEPAKKWRAGDCNMATHVGRDQLKKGTKINPLKASKRARGGKKK